MEFFRIKQDIPFMRHALVFNVISFVTFLLAVFFLATKGLHLSVEFTGGTLVEVKSQKAADLEKIRGALGCGACWPMAAINEKRRSNLGFPSLRFTIDSKRIRLI